MKHFLFLFLLSTRLAFAMEQIIRPYQSVRSAGMGGVRITTGLYDENFFYNPARVTANPSARLTLLQLTPIETNPVTLSAMKNMTSTDDLLGAVGQYAGKNLHYRFQLILPAFYLPTQEERKFALAFGLITGLQTDLNLRQSYQLDATGILDIGPAVTYGRKFLEDDKLSVGVTAHLIFRAGTNPTYGLLNYIQKTPLNISSISGSGGMIDFDLGSTYLLTQWKEFNVSAGVAIQNVLGGQYKNIPLKLGSMATSPPPQNRSMGLGISALRPSWWVLSDTLFAIEATDFFNNNDGSFYRLLHIGAETHWHSLIARLGLNQGYWTAGIGLSTRFFTLDIASYGEEMGLNAGSYEDRRYTLNLGFHL